MLIVAVDPGQLQSALLVYDPSSPVRPIVHHELTINSALVSRIPSYAHDATLVIERFASRGMPIGEDSIETVLWSGRFFEAWPNPFTRHWVTRLAVKIHLCGSARATDATVRQALLDRFGGIGGRETAIGRKENQGPLYGVKGHEFAALAVAVAWADMRAMPSVQSGD